MTVENAQRIAVMLRWNRYNKRTLTEGEIDCVDLYLGDIIVAQLRLSRVKQHNAPIKTAWNIHTLSLPPMTTPLSYRGSRFLREDAEGETLALVKKHFGGVDINE